MTPASSTVNLPRAAASRQRAGHQNRLPALMGLGTAVPPLRISQAEITAQMARIWNLTGRELQRWRGICENAGIEHRHGVLPIGESASLTTAQRMACYERFAPPLANAAALAALDDAGVAADRITDLIVVSCTGFSAPGLDVALCDCLGLAPTVRRNTIGFMGCFGAVTGLRAAVGACSADPHAAALVVCTELCSLHARNERDIDNQIASALFGDGAAAAIVLGPNAPERHGNACGGAIGRVNMGHSCLLPHGREWMTWRITDAGFAMTLKREVPIALREHIAAFVADTSDAAPRTFIVHPGGPGILDAVDDALQLHGRSGIECSRRVLRDCGNMSSATVLFVLQEAMRQNLPTPAMLLAFGPGLTIESIAVL